MLKCGTLFNRSSGSEEQRESEQTTGAFDPSPADPDHTESPHRGGPVPAPPDEHLEPSRARGRAPAHARESQAPDELPP